MVSPDNNSDISVVSEWQILQIYKYVIAITFATQVCCVLLLKVKWSAFTEASFSSLSDIHRCLGGFLISSVFPGQAHNWQGITTRLANVTRHWFSYILWHVGLKTALIDVIWLPYRTKLWQEKALVYLAVHCQSAKFYLPKSCEVSWAQILNGLCLCQLPKFSPLIFLQF